MKCNTQIGVKRIHLDGSISYENAKIARWHHSYGDKSEMPSGYHLVQFESGGKMTIHESNMVVY